jgi:uncharacterized protein (DUF1015 family)
MAEIRAFRGLLYREDSELARVLAPPYDVIPAAYRQTLLARDPHNVVRLVLAETEDAAGYARAGEEFRRWRQEGVLAEDAQEALYVLEQSFEAGGRPRRRYGLLARFRAEDPGRRSVLPHEHTRAAAKEDRWRLLLAARANFSPIFLMFPDPEGKAEARLRQATAAAPARAYSDDQGVGHRLWRVTDAAAIAAWRETLAGVTCYIADGHHRYATALRYRDAHGPDGAFTLGYFTPIGSEGLLVLPYHRILSAGPDAAAARRALDGAFRLRAAAGVAAAAGLVAASAARHAFALAWPSGEALVAESLPGTESWLAASEPASLRALDTYFVHRAVLPRLGVADAAVGYVHSLGEADEAVAQARCRLAILLRGTPVGQILDVAEAAESMPAKSTFFHPKLPSGLVIHPLLA